MRNFPQIQLSNINFDCFLLILGNLSTVLPVLSLPDLKQSRDNRAALVAVGLVQIWHLFPFVPTFQAIWTTQGLC